MYILNADCKISPNENAVEFTWEYNAVPNKVYMNKIYIW